MMELTVSSEILKAILSRMDEGIHVIDPSGTTIYYNEVAANHDGMKIEDVVGKPLLTAFPSLDRTSSTLLKVLENKTAIYNQAQVYINMYGKKIETMNTTFPIIVNQQFLGAMEIAKDYSTLKKLSEQLVDLQKRLQTKMKLSKKKSQTSYTFKHLLTKNPQMQLLKKKAEKLALSRSSILVYGESGTGKELFVQGMHNASPRAQSSFIAQNCAAIPETLLESILFGSSKGSYTGAVERPGLFELANGGSLFLDEIHAMPLELQAKLLRVLEDGVVRRVGSSKDIVVDVRIIAAMNVHPKIALENRMLRPDLYYRLNVLLFELIPLRKRREDILFLADVFVREYNQKLSKSVTGMDERLQKFFLSYKWPGNVRELRHSIEYMMNVCEGSILQIGHLPIILKEENMMDSSSSDGIAFREKVQSYEANLIREALGQTSYNIQQAAILLQLPRQTLQYKIKKYKL